MRRLRRWMHRIDWNVMPLVALLVIAGSISWLMYAAFNTTADGQKRNDEYWHQQQILQNTQQRLYADSQAAACKAQGGTPFNLDYKGKCVYQGVVVAEWDEPSE